MLVIGGSICLQVKACSSNAAFLSRLVITMKLIFVFVCVCVFFLNDFSGEFFFTMGQRQRFKTNLAEAFFDMGYQQQILEGVSCNRVAALNRIAGQVIEFFVAVGGGCRRLEVAAV